MREVRVYQCDYGHLWEVEAVQVQPEVEDDAVCPLGHEAVTRSDQIPADEVQILLRPAARIVDSVRGQVSLSGRYYLVLLDREDRELCCSCSHYEWEEAVKIAFLFKGKSEIRAMKWWERKRP